MMNLKIDCPHCAARASEPCTPDCEVNGNGRKLRDISLALGRINSKVRVLVLVATTIRLGLCSGAWKGEPL